MITLDDVIFIILIFLFVNTLLNLKRMSPAECRRFSGKWPSVSILVPVRNEERNIRRLLESLVRQDYPDFEIVVVNDGSTDRTWSIVKEMAERHPRLRAYQSRELPPEWTGKNWACHQLSRLARGEIFLFTDADTVHGSRALKKAVASARSHGSGLLSAVPALEAKTWSEKLYMPIIAWAFVSLIPFFWMNGRGRKGHSERPQEAGRRTQGGRKRRERDGAGRAAPRSVPAVLGPFLLIPRRIYEECGGHQAIRNDLVDDISLARRVIRQGEKTTLIDGSQFLRIRFYTCFRDLWAGFSKNSYEAVRGTPLKVAAVSVACFLLFIHPYLALIDSLFRSQLASLPLLQVATITLTRLILAERFRTSRGWVLLHPLSLLLALVILVNSCRLSILRKKIAWKERWYPVP